jgi:hypothetical protein
LQKRSDYQKGKDMLTARLPRHNAIQEIQLLCQTSGRIQFVDEIFQRLIDNSFAELPGLTVDASIPVPEQLINEINAAAIRGNANISSLEVSIHSGNRVSVNLRTRLWPWPLDLMLRLDHQVDLRDFPRVWARLENKVLLARIGSFLNVLPAGIDVRNDMVLLDIETLLYTPELKRMLDLIRSAEIRTQEGQVILDVKIKVGEENE